MKKQGKNLLLNLKTNQDRAKIESKGCAKINLTDNISSPRSPKERLRSKADINSPSNKENQYKTANQQIENSPTCPLSPLQCHPSFTSTSPSQASFHSPGRTAPIQNLAALRSNKGKEDVQDKSDNTILFSGFSKDGKYRVESHSLQGQELAKACEHERKMSVISRINSKKQSGQKLPFIDPARTSQKQNGIIKSYAVNTHQGISRNYNEDRVSITLNIKKKGVRAQFFAVYDGHGGNLCCDFLKDNLHELVINSPHFPSEPKKALAQAIQQTEAVFSNRVRKNRNQDGSIDKSGSCAIITLLVDDTCYVANVGDSRAIMSTEGGKMAFNLSRDHRPSDVRQQDRILQAGGKVYRTEMTKLNNQGQKIIGPLRILPGKLSVSRTIGDIEAKEPQLGGNKGIITPQPDIRKFKLTGKEDFILLCCDGILERMESTDTIQLVWKAMRKEGSMHEKAGKAVDLLIEQSMKRRSSDNLTAILLCLKQLKEENFRSPKKIQSKSK